MRALRSVAILSLSVIVLAAAIAVARKEKEDEALERRVDQLFNAYDKPGSPGCALRVVRDGNLVCKKGYGAASLELGVPLTPESVFYMGSVSKQFTAASVVLAAEQGFLSLDDDIRKYVPEIPSYGKPITLRQMPHHTSGFRDILSLLFLAGRNSEDIHPTSELLDLLSRQKALNFTPGDEFLYSNPITFDERSDPSRDGQAPFSVRGRKHFQAARDGAHQLLRRPHGGAARPSRRVCAAPGRRLSRRLSTNYDMVGGGGLMSSVDDHQLWDRNFYDNKLGKGTLLKEMQTQGVLNNGKQIQYALGLFISKYRGLPIVAHDGANFGYRTMLLRFPQQRLSVICLCNLGTSNPIRLSYQVADLYLGGQLAPDPQPAAGAKVDPQPFTGWYRNPESHSAHQLSAADSDIVALGTHFKAAQRKSFRRHAWGRNRF
ncbi:MAG TPA: serine hydrolase domain-containing protein [Candidatus Acidoferrum sp.]